MVGIGGRSKNINQDIFKIQICGDIIAFAVCKKEQIQVSMMFSMRLFV